MYKHGSVEKDSGWCWVVAAACGFNNFLTAGFVYSCGAYNAIFMEVFESSPAAVATISSILMSMYCVVGRFELGFNYVPYISQLLCNQMLAMLGAGSLRTFLLFS